jgi:spore germination protein GerM
MKRVVVALLTAVAVVVVAGCGVASQDAAERTDPKEVPFGLLDRNRGAEVGDRSGDRDVVVFLTKDGRLVRTVRSLAPPVTFDALLESLKQGPTRPELADGVRSAVPDDNTFESAELSGGTALVDLGKPFTAASTEEQVLALAQIVFTLTARPGVGQVQFTLDDVAVEIPIGDGSVTTEPVSRDDYVGLAPNV